jgi:hypothetical protein
MKKVITYDLETGLWEVRVASDNTVLSAGELEAKVVTCDITHWDDTQLGEFAAQDREAQVFDLEQLEFAEWNRRWVAERDARKAVRS